LQRALCLSLCLWLVGQVGFLPWGRYMAPLQGVVSLDGSSVAAPTHLQPFVSQPQPKRCATHCHIARSIHLLQQFMKMGPFWAGAHGAAAAAAAAPSTTYG
ncbi:hypothetical protein M569_08031, partial [Genlisea aurea]